MKGRRAGQRSDLARRCDALRLGRVDRLAVLLIQHEHGSAVAARAAEIAAKDARKDTGMPVDYKNYPPDWRQIALAIKDGCGWACQFCGMQCRKPGEPFDTHKRTMSVAHLNHTPMDCRPENLRGLCSACHLRYDAHHHARNAAETRRRQKIQSGQQELSL